MRAKQINEELKDNLKPKEDFILIDVEKKFKQVMLKPNELINNFAKSFIGKNIYVSHMKDDDYKEKWDVFIKVKDAKGEASNALNFSILFLDENNIKYWYQSGPIYVKK